MSPISKLMRDGYLTSTASVILLAAVSWKTASRDPLLMACLILGAIASVAGMIFRWRAHLLEVQAKADSEAEKSPMSSNRLFRQGPR